KEDPIDWWFNDFQKEFQAGRLIAFSTNSDGVFTLKFVQRPLTATETKALIVKESFRYEVKNGRIYWDNTDHLPSDDQLDEAQDDPEGWLELPNGRYKVTAHSMDWFSIPDAEREAEKDISHYIIQFEKVASFDDIPVSLTLPWLPPSKSWYEQRMAQNA